MRVPQEYPRSTTWYALAPLALGSIRHAPGCPTSPGVHVPHSRDTAFIVFKARPAILPPHSRVSRRLVRSFMGCFV